MPFIAFVGCDGSGKSAVIRRVAELLRGGGIQVKCGHWRPVVLFMGSTDRESVSVENPHGRDPRGFATSVLKLGWLWFNWWAGWWTGLRKARGEGFVLFDRFHGDVLADPRRYRYGGPLWLARIATRVMPQPDMVLYLDAPPEVLLSRKQEVSRDALEQSRHRYSELGKMYQRFLTIDASQSLDLVVDDVLLKIMGPPHKGEGVVDDCARFPR